MSKNNKPRHNSNPTKNMTPARNIASVNNSNTKAVNSSSAISKLPVDAKTFKELTKDVLKKELDIYAEQFNKFWNTIKNITYTTGGEYTFTGFHNRVHIKGMSTYITPNFMNYTWPICDSEEALKKAALSYFSHSKMNARIPSYSEIREDRPLFANIQNIFLILTNSSYEVAYRMDNQSYRSSIYTDDLPNLTAYPVISCATPTTSDGMLRIILIPFDVTPTNWTTSMKETFSDLRKLFLADNGYVSIKEDGITVDTKKLLEDFMKTPDTELFTALHWRLTAILKECRDKKELVCNDPADIKNSLLTCEKIRADIEPYEERILTDPNRGHWDLWNIPKSDYKLNLGTEFFARDPRQDINENGIIAIDFGTKSTIVVYQSDIDHSLPMGIGDGNLSKSPSPKRYENPTVMHFVNLDKFMEAYNAKAGRPSTEWKDLTISHTANDQFSVSKSEDYYEYLRQLKQWAGQREKPFRLKSHNGESIILPSFLDLKDNDINPIELYAYYIGLYINNMRKGHGIFLDYYLSFPVTYETKIREKIIESFSKGLKKSLPTSILNDPDIMKNFHVNGSISEPAAYAVCALQEYGFDPGEDEEIFYGIFDFGGGTTDFDFGLWTQSSKRRYDYAIENFGAGGDEFLGGENLLEMLAFEVFKDNQNFMREKGYTFTLAPKCTEFLGSDALLSDSQEAEKNMHNLMEVLRPYWELSDDGCKQYLEKYWAKDKTDSADIELKVTLFDRDGKSQVNETLKTNINRIYSFIEGKIREGINNFFSALLLSYQNERVKKPTTVNILLAGNSCKSPIVKKIFEEEINSKEKEIRDRYNIKDTTNKMFEIFPPLGTPDAYAKMKQLNLPYSENDFEKPTGKTGVAFGLLQCRNGGVIERIVHTDNTSEIPFQYFIGTKSRGKFVLFKDDSKTMKYKGKPDYNVWYEFIEADADTFELYYTSLPECVNGKLIVDGNAGVKRQRCNIDVVDDNAFVYIRATDPHTIQYVVAKNNNVESSKLGQIITKELG